MGKGLESHFNRLETSDPKSLHKDSVRQKRAFGSSKSKAAKATLRKEKQEQGLLERPLELEDPMEAMRREHMRLALKSLFDKTADPETVLFVLGNEPSLEKYGYRVDTYAIETGTPKEIVVFKSSAKKELPHAA